MASEDEEPTIVAWSTVYVTTLVAVAQGAAFYTFFAYQRGQDKKKYNETEDEVSQRGSMDE